MKKWKKPLSVLLAVVMAFSSMTVAFSVFAAARPLDTVDQIKQAILDDYKKGDGFPKLEADLKAAYTKLTEAQKDSLGAQPISQIFRMSYLTETGTSAEKAEKAITALGGLTTRQKQAYDYAVAFSDGGKVTVDGKEVISRFTSYKFNAAYSSGSGATKVVYSQEVQKAYFESLTVPFKTMIQSNDAYVIELANSLTATTTGTGSNGVGYVYGYGGINLNAINNMLKAALVYTDVYKKNSANQALTPTEKQEYVLGLLGLDKPGSSFDVWAIMKDYAGQSYRDALALYLKDKTANRDAFVTAVKTAYDKAAIEDSLEKAVAASTVSIIVLKDDKNKESLTTVNALWQPVADNYAALLVIEEQAKVDITKLLTKEDVTKALASYNELSSNAKKLVTADATAKAKYDAIVKTGNDIETADFRKMVVDYVIPAKITDANKDAVVAFVNSCETAYKAFNTTLKNYIRDNYTSINDKYTQILDLRNLVDVSPFVDKVDAFDLKAAQGAELNIQIEEIRKAYTAFSSTLKTYIKDKQQATYTKYNQILQCWAFVPGQDLHGEFVSETVASELPAPLDTAVYETFAPQLENLLRSFLPALTGSDNVQALLDSQFTNANVTAFVKLIYPAFYDIVEQEASMGGMMNTTPSEVGAKLEYDEKTMPQFKAAKETLAKYTTMESWKDVPADMDWGVIPGDYETFINALLGSLVGVSTSPILGASIMNMLKATFVGSYSTTPDGQIDQSSFQVGAWDYFITPLLEALGVPSEKIMNNVAYANYVNGDNTIRGYLKPVTNILYYNLIPEVSKAPVDYLFTNLPNLVYHLEDGCLMNGLNEMLNHLVLKVPIVGDVNIKDIIMGLFKGADGTVPTELSMDLIFNMLAPTISSIGLDLTLEDLYRIGHFGNAEKVDTSRISVDKAVKVIADKESFMNYLMNFVYSLLPNLGIDIDFAVKGEFVKAEAPKYPHNGKMDKKVMNAMVDGLDGLLGGLLKINDIINSALCTNEMAANAMTGIYGALAPTLAAIGINVNPKDVATMMHEDRYAELRLDLQIDAWSDAGLVIKNDKEVVYQTNMGFKDGDRDGFVNTIVAMLRPLVKALADNNLVVNTATSNGLYETLIIPMFEAIGLTPAVDSATYTENYRLLAAKGGTGAYDYLVKTILSPVLGLLNDFAAAPAKTLMKLLPNLAYAIQYNPTLAFVGNLLDGMGGLTGILNGAIGGLIEGFTLPEIPLDALASCGTFEEKTSRNAAKDKYTVVAADTADAFVTVYYYLYDAVNNGNNLQLLKDMIANVEMEDALKGVVNNILNDVFTASKEDSLCKLGELLAADVWACPDGDGNGGKKTPSTGDYAIPAAVFLTMMVGAGAVIVLMRKKREGVSN